MKKILKIFILMIIGVISLENMIYATATEFKIIDKNGQIKNLENDQGYISKLLVDSNVNNGEVTIELKLSNTSSEEKKIGKTEVIFAVDNSASMGTTTTTGNTIKQEVINSMITFVDKLYEQNSNIYIGLVKFSESGNVICNLTNEKQTMLSAITAFEKTTLESNTNISAGITTANSQFTSDCKNKIIVLLTDGISEVTTTKNTLLNVAKTGTYIISMINQTNSQEVTQIFGTQEKPTTGKFYNIESANINQVISDSIFNDILETIQKPIKNITITDYFPDDIINNFEFSYVENPKNGTISEKIDPNKKCIVWTINNLLGTEEVTVRYKLKLKDMNNQSIINKIIPTNDKVELYYTDYDNKKYSVILENSPKVQLFMQKEETNQTENKDTTIINKTLPKTGENNTMIIIGLLFSTFTLIWRLGSKYNKLK